MLSVHLDTSLEAKGKVLRRGETEIMHVWLVAS